MTNDCRFAQGAHAPEPYRTFIFTCHDPLAVRRETNRDKLCAWQFQTVEQLPGLRVPQENLTELGRAYKRLSVLGKSHSVDSAPRAFDSGYEIYDLMALLGFENAV